MAPQDRTRSASSSTRRADSRKGSSQKKAVVSILMMAAALLLFIAFVSYDVADEGLGVRFSDLFRAFTSDAEARAKADLVHNALGLAGAWLSNIFIKETIGYAVFVLPFLLGLWGWTILRGRDVVRSVQITNYTLAAALLFSSVFGMSRLIFTDAGPGTEWCGAVGYFIASILARLLGRVGGSIVLLAGILITAVLAVDLDLHQTIERIKELSLRLWDWLERKRDAWQEHRAQAAASRAAGETRESGGETDEPTERAPVRITKPPLEEPAAVAPVMAEQRAEASPASTTTAKPPMKIERRATPEDNEGPEEALGEQVEASSVLGTEDLDYVFPSVDLLDAPRPGKEDVDDEELKANADLLRDTLAEFDVEVESVSVTPGPVVTLYELVPATGVKISRIVSLENDIALKLAAKGIRIMAPIPGKSAVGVEIPNSHRSLVTVRSVINSNNFRDTAALLPLAMGKTIAGEVFTDDLSKMPHLLIAGSTGSGKSVGINTILASLLYRMHPSSLKLVIVDPKKIELAQYGSLKNHFLAVSPDVDEEIITTPHNAVMALKGVEFEMENRYDRLSHAGVRNIADYNEKLKSGKLKNTDVMIHSKMPYLIVVIDELADLMITAAREVEEPIARLAQLARAVGIHLIVATQRPSVDVITGVIKANFPARIAYQVASKTDSRTILDMNGAEQLLGNGDMLYLPSGSPKPVRLQNAYISPDEVDAVVGHISRQQGYARPFMLPSIAEKKRSGGVAGSDERDELFVEAAHLVVRHQQGSVSLLQRRLKVGYSRAARLVDELEAAGIVGPFDGSKAREVLVETEAELEVILNE
jgi:DNA segregation ATPase FtsK/SpoIIIE, S-DNA-T family